jgi:hypothetical protein
MVRRETEPSLLNKISNDPSVYSMLAGRYVVDDVIDWSSIFPMARTGIVALSNGEDAFQIYELVAPRIWEVFTAFVGTCRGKRALETGRAFRDWMEPHADLIYGGIPDSLPQAKIFYTRLGGERVPYVVIDGVKYVAIEGEEMFAWRVH